MPKPIIHKAIENDKLSPRRRLDLDTAATTHIVQPKHDGCFAMVCPDGSIRTRTGEKILSCEHIQRGIQTIIRSYVEPGTARRGVYHLGELWIPGTPQQEISGLVRQHSQAPSLHFVVFDVLTAQEFAEEIEAAPYRERYRKRVVYTRFGDSANCIYPVDSYNPGTYLSVPRFLDLYTKKKTGYDGIILRHPEGRWVVGAGTGGEIIKVKPTTTFDLEVVGVVEGLGKYKGMAGKLQFRWTNGRILEASGGTNAQRALWYSDPSSIVGKIGEVEGLGLTEDGMLREPRFKGVRFDKEAPDL